jgi:hypothetical protein
MGRKRKVGKEACLKCNNLGYYITKWTRNGEWKNSIGNMYSYFRHNNPTLKDCYIQNIFYERVEEVCKNLKIEKSLALVNQIYNYLTIVGKSFNEIKKKFSTYPLKADEKDIVDLGLEWYEHKYINPILGRLDIDTTFFEYESRGIIKSDLYDSIKDHL